MKQFIFYLLLAFNFSLFSEAVAPDYFIVKSNKDATLKKTQSAFTFTFYNSKGKPVNQEIVFSYNGTEKKQQANAKGEITLQVKPGKYVFNFYLDLKHYEITTDSLLTEAGFRTEVQVNFKSSVEPALMKKPVIYVYPMQEQKVSVKLDIQGDFLFTYPEYKNGWEFIAEPNGVIKMKDKKYHYLFWDGNIAIQTANLNLNEGFVVDKNNLVAFFEEKLKTMGLNSQEIEDYITYWCPLMNKNEKNYIHFMFNEEYNNYATISIYPKPDHLFRVCMLWSDATKNPVVKDQEIETFNRTGFTVVEWGGAELEHLVLKSKL